MSRTKCVAEVSEDIRRHHNPLENPGPPLMKNSAEWPSSEGVAMACFMVKTLAWPVPAQVVQDFQLVMVWMLVNVAEPAKAAVSPLSSRMVTAACCSLTKNSKISGLDRGRQSTAPTGLLEEYGRESSTSIS